MRHPLADVDVGVAEGTVGDVGTSVAVDWTTRLAHEHRESCEYKGLIAIVIRWYPFQMNPTER